MQTSKIPSLNNQINEITDSLDIPQSYFDKATERYESMGEWLEREDSAVAEYSPEIFPQGSFRLGTITKPASNEDDYDIDLVCKLSLSKESITQKQLKELVGGELEKYASAHSMKNKPEDRRRAWSLKYSDQASFHLDVLPSIPNDSSTSENAIAITDNKHKHYDGFCSNWESTNPEDYARWFVKTMHPLIRSIETKATDVPRFENKMPLQRVVQILKRHRDINYVGDPDDKPISIIITTLAGYAYEGESDTLSALIGVIERFENSIYIGKTGELRVDNPTNMDENFADKWGDYPNRQKEFFNWFNQIKIDLGGLLSDNNPIKKRSIKQFFGKDYENLLNLQTARGDSINFPTVVLDKSKLEKPWGVRG